jgi:hypothetical protein
MPLDPIGLDGAHATGVRLPEGRQGQDAEFGRRMDPGFAAGDPLRALAARENRRARSCRRPATPHGGRLRGP